MESAVILIVATTGCLVRREPARIGFAVFGWGGLVLAFGPWSKWNTGMNYS